MRCTFLAGACAFVLVLCFTLVLTYSCVGEGKPLPAGSVAEKRFPPLVVPEGFKATLFACDPLIEYPSAIAAGPRLGALFVAIDYMTGLGTEIVRRDEIRLLEDTHGNGHADRVTVFARGFNSIQGLAYHNGTLFVMHAPYLTALRDTRGVGKADERRDLLTGLGLAPEVDQIRLHNANGVVVGHDGWLYLALGDHGCDVKRPEGDRLVHNGGGILRCRPDGRDLHVFSTGLRNIYDVALDEDLNVFVRDNENDGGDYKIRVCHSFFGADHGYPYLYFEHPDEALPPLADLGLGSSAGAACYLESHFPSAYRGSLLFCEWGRSVVRYPLKRSGASFASARETDFASGAGTDPYGFKPTDLVVDRDGSLFVSDWADGQRPRRGRGRIYRIRFVGKKGDHPVRFKERALPDRLDELVAWLDSESHSERCRAQYAIEQRGRDGARSVEATLKAGRLGIRGRLHAIWVFAKVEQVVAIEKLLAQAKTAAEPRIQAQAVRAIADLADPVLVRHRLEAGAGDAKLARRLADLGEGKDVIVQLEIAIALGRMRWVNAPAWLRKTVAGNDLALAHAAKWALQRSGNWPAVLYMLDGSGGQPCRAIARRAIAEQYNAGLVDGLIGRLKNEADKSRLREFADLLTRVHKKPGRWTYWGFRPTPRPANSVAWERTEAIEGALDGVLGSSDKVTRPAILKVMLRESVPASGKTLASLLKQERDGETVAALLAALRGRPSTEARFQLESVLRDPKHTTANRLLAVSLFLDGLAGKENCLPGVAAVVEDGPVLAELLRAIGARKVRAGSRILLSKLASANALVRAAAVEAVGDLADRGAWEPVRKLLDDADAGVRGAAARAAGKLEFRPAADRLLELARDADAGVRRSSLGALRNMREPRALTVAVAALKDDETAVHALDCIAALGGTAEAAAVADLAHRRPSADILASAGKALAGWASQKGLSSQKRRLIDQALGEIGSSGVLLGWHILGPLPDHSAILANRIIAGNSLPTSDARADGWCLVLSLGTDARVRIDPVKAEGDWLAYSEVICTERTPVEFFTTTFSAATIWLNGKRVHRRDKPAVPGPYPERFEAILEKGINRVLVRLEGVKRAGEFQLRFRRKSATAAHERLTRAALSRAGNPEAGRNVFFDGEKSLCVKCHRVGDKGEFVGPELTGLGNRFSKAYIIESILEPSRTVSPSFESARVELKSGRILIGIKVAESESSITLVDSETKKHVLARSGIEMTTKQPGSAMPDGLEKRLTEDEFVDLVSFLVSLKGRQRQ
jgi:putative membrane-bound dehydrogenase-like protein